MSYDLGTAHGKIVLDYNGDKAVDSAERDIDRLAKKSKESDGHLKKLGATLKGLGKGVALTGLVASLTNAAFQAAAIGIQILGIIPNLVSLLSLSSALPGMFVGVAVAVGVLKASLAGVGDAVKAAFGDDPAKFEEALKKLAPQAREFAVALRELAPFFKQVQQGIQDAFFANNFQDIFPAVKAAVKGLQPSLNGLAAQFGDIAKSIVEFATSAESIRFVQAAVDTLRNGIDNVAPSIAPVLAGLRDVGTVGLPLLDQLSVAIADVGQRFGDWLSEIAADGRLEAWIETALNTLSELGQVIGNVGSILNSVFSAAQATGGGLLATIADITGQFAFFLNSAEGKTAITELFAGILAVAKQLAPIFTTLAGALAQALGPALQEIATGVGPELLKVVQALAPAFGPLAKGIADLLVAVAPLIPPLAQLVALIATQLGTGLSVLAAELGPVIALLGGAFLQAFQKLSPIMETLAENALPLAAALGQDLLTALMPLAPVIVELAQAFADAILPVLPELISAFEDLLPAIVTLAAAFTGGLVSGIRAIIPLLPTIVGAFVALATVAASVVTGFVQMETALLQFSLLVAGAIAAVIGWFIKLPAVIGSALTSAYNFVVSVGTTIVNWFVGLGPRIAAILTALPGIIAGSFKRALEFAATALGFGIGLLVGIAVKLPQRIIAAIASLPGLLLNLVRNAWTVVGTAFNSGVNAAVNFARNLGPRTRSAIAALGSIISGIATAAWNSLRARFNNGVSQATSIANNLPGRIRSALGNLRGILYDAGSAIINGLIGGIRSGIDRVLGLVSDLADRVRGAFNRAMEIFSPSRVMFRAGVFIDEGLIDGIKSKLKEVGATAQMLAGAVIRPSVSMKLKGAIGTLVANATIPNVQQDTADAGVSHFGPYHLEVDGRVIASIVVDTITGNPTVVSKSAKEGDRKDDWVGAGGRGRGTN